MPTAADHDRRWTITIQGSGQQFACESDEPVLRAALRAGLGFPYECNVGSCGNCRYELIEGEVEHAWADAPAFTERDLKRNRRLGCQSHPRSDCTIKVRLDPKYVAANKPVRTLARIAGVTPITHDISEFALDLETPSSFLPGQYALLGVDEVEGARAYSMCNLGHEKKTSRWCFQIKRVPGGKLSELLFGHLKTGDPLMVEGPFGMAYLREDAPRDIVLIAGGSGLSPMISIARAAADSERLQGRTIHFFYGGRAPRDVTGRQFLEELSGWNERIHYHAAISEKGHHSWNGPVGFVNELVLETLGERLKDHEVYFAGPPAMAQAVQKTLFEAQVPGEQVHFDEFF